MIVSLFLLGAMGFLLSFYGYFVELKLKNNPSYKSVCDISENISCTKPILSKYGQLFFVSNTVVGMAFYALVMLFSFLHFGQFVFVLSCGALGASAVLAYILYFKVRTFCLICNSIYVINIALFLLSLAYR